MEEIKEIEKSVTEETPVEEATEVKAEEYGKFKSGEELLKAYNELEREFTKKSQRLKELERVVPTDKPAPFKERVEKFFKENQDARPYAKEIALFLEENPAYIEDKRGLDVALGKVLLKKSPLKLASDEKFLKEHIYSNSAVKEKIIEDFLKGLSENNPPAVIRGGQSIVSPPSKPRTIEEAGWQLMKLEK